MAARMRDRGKILGSLETVYREAFESARESGDDESMARLDFEYQRDQLQLEVLLDVRDLLATSTEEPEGAKVTSLIDRAQKLKNLTRLR